MRGGQPSQNGPLHNNIPNPATLPHADNNSMWVPDFSSDHFNKMLYTTGGITQRVRTDLTGPDGHAGVSLAGIHDAQHVPGDVQGPLHG